MTDIEKALEFVRNEIEVSRALDGDVSNYRRIEVLLMKLERLEDDKDLARAWLICIIKALISMEEQTND